MAQTGILGQSKPIVNTNTLLYKAPYDQSASSVLTITNDGTGSAYSVGIKDWSQKLTVGASNYLLHEGDIFTSYRITMNNTFDTNAGFTGGLTNLQRMMVKRVLTLNRISFLNLLRSLLKRLVSDRLQLNL